MLACWFHIKGESLPTTYEQWDAHCAESDSLPPPVAEEGAEDEATIAIFYAQIEVDFILKAGVQEKEKKRTVNIGNDPTDCI